MALLNSTLNKILKDALPSFKYPKAIMSVYVCCKYIETSDMIQ